MGSIKKNILYNFGYQVFILLIPFITSPYISRVLGPQGLGSYTYTFSIVGYFVLFANLGISNHGNRSIAMVNGDVVGRSKKFFEIGFIQIIAGSISIIVYLCFVSYFESRYQTLGFIWTIYLISAVLDISWFYFGMEQFKIAVTRGALVKIITLVCIFIFIKSAKDVPLYALLFSISALISQIILWLLLPKYIVWVKPNCSNVKRQIKPILVLFIPVIAVSLYGNLNKIFLGKLSYVQDVAYYSNADQICRVPIALLGSIGTALLPRMSNLFYKKKDSASSNYYMSLSFELTAIISGLFMAGFITLGESFSILFWGDKFSQSGVLLGFLSLQLPFVSWANVIRTQYLIPRCKDREYVISVAAGGVVNVLICLTMIKDYGSIAAAVGLVAAEITVCLLQTFLLRNEIQFSSSRRAVVLYYSCSTLLIVVYKIIFRQNLISWTVFIFRAILILVIYSFLVFCIGLMFKLDVYDYGMNILKKRFSKF